MSDGYRVSDLVFVGFNSRVVALDRDGGRIVWEWKAASGTASHVAILLDGDRLIVSVNGYTYCLDPLTGTQLWFNPLSGFGLGIPALVSVRGSSGNSAAAAATAAVQQQHSQTAASTAVIGT